MMSGRLRPVDCKVPIFQLLQWKHAIHMEDRARDYGWPLPFGRSVRAHACRHLGLRPRTKSASVLQIIDTLLERPTTEERF